MKIRNLVGTLALSVASVGTTFAAQQTVTLAVDNMTCSTCPYTVKKALNQVPGVENATVSYEEKSATVTFEDTEASVADLTAATTNAGYPSRLAAENTEQAE
ncbi:mercury resistance system periplasmic binding protein MerP [Chromohalobacter israelensis]|uniref:mercury resistance system periplasmic binding protein MerP n=1 Tax=Chromohalobacter israelensis TaxID=141390 RepID=UPI001CC567AB|nr:mercury resistance system periplasmic binding protein MerP [Chromohalobacter salexigens]MBZ5877836.1 mercury resistance system periplasmic binding protein MerP [Chromohalobacter salexigens]